MTVSIRFRGANEESDGPFELASVGAWSAFAKWVRSLDAKHFPKLHELIEDGSSGPTSDLSVELDVALETGKPTPGVKATGEALQEKIGMGAEDEVVAIVDENDEDDEESE